MTPAAAEAGLTVEVELLDVTDREAAARLIGGLYLYALVNNAAT